MKRDSWVLPVLNLLGLKRDEPVQIGGAVASPFEMPSAQIIPLHPRSEIIEEPLELEEPDNGVVTSLNRIPAGTVLTADVGVRYFRLPKGQETSLLALEVSPKRVEIFYSNDADKSLLDRLMGELRHRLLIDGYELIKEPRACDESIILAILENHRRSADAQETSSENSPARQLWERIVDIAWRSGASDLHIEMREPMAQVKVRIDNDLEPLSDGGGGVYTSSQVQAAVAWAFGDATEKNSNNTSLFSVDAFSYSMFKPRLIDGTKVGMRFQSLKGGSGPKAITRMFQVDSQAVTRSFQELGYSESQRRLLRKAQKRSSGLILFGGVTNSGKTVALKTFMETHPMNGVAAFYSVEDPIELPLKNVHQIPVRRDLANPEQSDKAYSEVISSVMRADPDGLLISEIRDSASAAAAEQMLETGHFAAASIHAKFIHGFVSRLSMPKIGFDRAVFTEPDVITLLNYQSLVAVICPKCRINAEHADQFANIHVHTDDDEERMNEIEDIRALISTAKSKFRLDPSTLYFRRKGGCPQCKGRGTVGRTVVSEMYMPDDNWRKKVRDRQDFDAIDYYRSFSDGEFTSPDMTGKSIFEHTLYKAIRGQVDPRECEQFYGFEEFVLVKGKN